MVFGYYHISTKTLDKNEASALGCPPNGRISHKVKVGHMLWIPFFPLDNYWVMDAAGQSYMLNYNVSNQLKAKHEPSGTPWYAFFGLIAIPVILGIAFLSNMLSTHNRETRYKKMHTEMVTARHAAIESPKTTDYYQFKMNNYKKVVFKVNKDSQDSIQFKAPLDNKQKKWTQKNWAVGFYSGDNPTKLVSFAKSDLKNSFKNIYKSNEGIVPLNSAKIPWAQKMTLDKISHMEGISASQNNTNIPVVSAAENNAIKNRLQGIIDNLGNVDSLMANMDKESHEYYKMMLSNASNMDFEAANYVKNSRNDIGKMETMLFTKYIYLKTGDTQEKDLDNLVKNMKDVKGYLFFLSLMDRSFLTINKEITDKITINEITVPNSNKAIIKLSAPSNILKSKKNINFVAIMHKENNKWMINVPSTYSYTTAQVYNSAGYNNRQAYMNQFKDMVIADIEKMMDGKSVHSSFKS